MPGAGWIGLDATSGLLCGEGHIPLSRDAALPLRRARSPATVERREVEFSLRHEGRRAFDEAPRITMPFSDETWEELDALGDAVDRDLVAHDVRLTMGGEPTFVSIDDFKAAEWNTAAVGPTKRARRRRADPPAARRVSRPAACCITARANGIPAKACRAGPSRSTGARTASRSGAIPI